MKNRINLYLLGLISILLALSGCSEEVGGGAGSFDTVIATASVSTADLDSDLATWTDVNGDGFVCGANDTFTVSSDDVTVDIAVDTKANLPSTREASKVSINKVSIAYSPANTTTPSLSTQFETLGVVVDPDSTATVSFKVASQDLKKSSILSPLVCSNTIYTYFVTLTFEGVEVDTNRTETFETTLNLRFADFANQ
ncbi:MAG: hypothetical protein HZA13_08540 [Nitrospirae bacterium]|nr:hypothetical protein [Nitrospirota bacterium]